MKIRFLIIIGILLLSIFPNKVYAMCSSIGFEWWMPCNDTGMFSDGIYIKYSILIPIVIAVILILSFVLLRYWRKRNES